MIHNSILFDIGGTKIRIAYSPDEQSFEAPKVFYTPENFEDGLRLFVETAKQCASGREIKNIVGGMSRNIPNYQTENIKSGLEKEFGVEVNLENDSAMVGLGEAVYGAGKNHKILAYITISTGVGGARIVDGRIDEHSIGFEPGKQIIDIENNKTLEDLLSGKALQKRIGKIPKEITDPKVWEEEARVLAIGLYNIIVEWSPDCIVLGGSMMTGDPAIPLDLAIEQLKRRMNIFPNLPVIKKAELQDFGGLWGGLALLNQI